MRIIVFLNSTWSAVNFRAGLIERLVSAGHDVLIYSPRDRYVAKLEEIGVSYVESSMRPHSLGFDNIFSFFEFLKISYRFKPDFVFSFTIKPNIFAAFASRAIGFKVIQNVAGIGRALSSGSVVNSFVRWLYALSSLFADKTFFQNAEDLKLFEGLIGRKSYYTLLPGSGVDLEKFYYHAAMPRFNRPIRFLMFCRLLKGKGVVEFCLAARSVFDSGHNVQFVLVGFHDASDSDSVDIVFLRSFGELPFFSFVEGTDEIDQYIIDSDCVVLPSYYAEGTPRSLLEACAIGRPIITTNMPGCRDVIIDGENGFLVAPKSIESLVSALLRFLDLSFSERLSFGQRSRILVEENFNEEIVINRYLDELC